MKKSKRYDTSHFIEDQTEPGSRGRVIRNILHITQKAEMDRREKAEQMRTIEELTTIFAVGHRFTAADICKMHKMWLGNIYEWAGKYRQGEGGQGGFFFSFSEKISKIIGNPDKRQVFEISPR